MAVATGVDGVLARAVAAGAVPGVVALAADADGVFYEGAFGQHAFGEGPAMGLDSVFAIMSMTKPITSVAALQLVERGRVIDRVQSTSSVRSISLRSEVRIDGPTWLARRVRRYACYPNSILI